MFTKYILSVQHLCMALLGSQRPSFRHWGSNSFNGEDNTTLQEMLLTLQGYLRTCRMRSAGNVRTLSCRGQKLSSNWLRQ